MVWSVANMVCQRCIYVLEQILQRLAIAYKDVQIGKIEFDGSPSAEQQERLKLEMEKMGFTVAEDKTRKLISDIKAAIHRYLEFVLNGSAAYKLSVFISRQLNYDYRYLSNVFSKQEGQTIEYYFIDLRLDKIKERLVYTHDSMADITYALLAVHNIFPGILSNIQGLRRFILNDNTNNNTYTHNFTL